MLALSFALLGDGLPFPGYVALLPNLGAAAILAATAQTDYPGYRQLAARPLAAIGKTSYTLYLWHWPVFCLVDYSLLTIGAWQRALLKVGLSAALTAITYVLIETPLRRFLNQPSRRRHAFAFFLVSLAIAVPLGLKIRADNYINATAAEVSSGGKVYTGTGSDGTVLLLGDSNGSMYGMALRQACRNVGCTLIVGSVAAGDALPRSDGQNGKLWTNDVALAKSSRPDVIILVNAWSEKLEADPGKLPRALADLAPFARMIVILEQPPLPPPSAERSAIRSGARPPFLEAATNAQARHRIDTYIQRFAGDNVMVLDVAPFFEGPDGSVEVWDENGRPLFHDNKHLSNFGAERLRPRLEEILSDDLRQQKSAHP